MQILILNKQWDFSNMGKQAFIYLSVYLFGTINAIVVIQHLHTSCSFFIKPFGGLKVHRNLSFLY